MHTHTHTLKRTGVQDASCGQEGLNFDMSAALSSPGALRRALSVMRLYLVDANFDPKVSTPACA
jgi:hypothetical protein